MGLIISSGIEARLSSVATSKTHASDATQLVGRGQREGELCGAVPPDVQAHFRRVRGDLVGDNARTLVAASALFPAKI